MLNLINGLVVEGQVLNLAITQGKTYQFSFYYPANLTVGELRGQVRSKYAQDNGELLAEFTFNSTYDDVENKSLCVATIDALSTASIPYTKFQGIGEPNIKSCYVYDIEYEENEVVIELFRGLVQVKAEATV